MKYFFLLLIISSLLQSCSREDGSSAIEIYHGQLYKGEIILPNSEVDISDLSFGVLSKPITEVEDEFELFESLNEIKYGKFLKWNKSYISDLNKATEKEKRNLDLKFICEYMDLLNLELAELWSSNKLEEMNSYIIEKVGEKSAKETKKTNIHIINTAENLIYSTGSYDEASSLGIIQQRNKFLKANCPKYNSFIKLIEKNRLINFEGKVSNISDINNVYMFLKGAEKVVKFLPIEDRVEVFADVICQVLSRAPDIGHIENTLQFEDVKNRHSQNFNDVEAFIIDKQLSNLGIATTFQEKRLFRKKLYNSCPIYNNWANRQYEIYKIYTEPFVEMLGLSHLPKRDVSFTPPASITFDSINQLGVYFKKLNTEWIQERNKLGSDATAEWALHQTCEILNNLDLSYANKKGFVDWFYTASLNYNLGIERPEDVKILIYGQMLSFFDYFLENGEFYNVGSTYRKYQFHFGFVNNKRKIRELVEHAECKEQFQEIRTLVKNKNIDFRREYYDRIIEIY